MAREKQDSFAAGQGALVVFQSVVHDDLGNIFPGVAGEEAEFGKLASEGNEFPAQQAMAVLRGHIGEGQGEIAHADGA
jgi:hypothetical protein